MFPFPTTGSLSLTTMGILPEVHGKLEFKDECILLQKVLKSMQFFHSAHFHGLFAHAHIHTFSSGPNDCLL